MQPAILFVAHRVPYPPDKGDRIRTYNILKFLARRARVHLACLADEPVSLEQRANLESLCERVAIIRVGASRWLGALASLARGGTVTEGAFASSELERTIRGWSSTTRYHSCLVSSSGLARYACLPELGEARAVVDLIDVDSQKWLDYAAQGGPTSWLYRLEGRRLRALEKDLDQRFHGAIVVSEAEAALYRQFGSAAFIHAIPNGVDLEYFRPQEVSETTGCVFVGAMDYKPNALGAVFFCQEVWPALYRHRPDACCLVVGRRPTPAVQALATIPGVEVVGPATDVRAYVASTNVVIAPLQIARGIQNKVLEGLAMGKAVVTSSPALAGLKARPGEHLLCADEPSQWVEKIQMLWRDADLRRRLGAAGRRFVEENHRWEITLKPLASLLGLPDDPVKVSTMAQPACMEEKYS